MSERGTVGRVMIPLYMRVGTWKYGHTTSTYTTCTTSRPGAPVARFANNVHRRAHGRPSLSCGNESYTPPPKRYRNDAHPGPGDPFVWCIYSPRAVLDIPELHVLENLVEPTHVDRGLAKENFCPTVIELTRRPCTRIIRSPTFGIDIIQRSLRGPWWVLSSIPPGICTRTCVAFSIVVVWRPAYRTATG